MNNNKDKNARREACKVFTLKMGWEILANAIFRGREISRVQHDEMRNMYYVAFAEHMAIVTEISELMTETEACKKLSELAQEAREYTLKGVEDARAEMARQKK